MPPLPLAAMIAWGILALAGLAIFFGCPLVWGAIGRRWMAREAIIPFEPRRPVPWLVALVVIAAVGYIVFFTFSYLVPIKAGPPATEESEIAWQILGGGALQLIFLGALMLLLTWFSGATLRDFGLDAQRLGHDIGLGLLAFLAMSIPTYGLQIISIKLWKDPSHPVTDMIAETSSPLVVVALTLLAVFVAPLFEELVFRVILQGWLEALMAPRASRESDLSDFSASPLEGVGSEIEEGIARTIPGSETLESLSLHAPNDSQEPVSTFRLESSDSIHASPALTKMLSILRPVLPILVSSTLFALAHIGYGPSAIPLFFFAIALGYLYQQTHRLWPSLVVHMSLNALTMLMLVASLLSK